jgi:hypothetical protein
LISRGGASVDGLTQTEINMPFSTAERNTSINETSARMTHATLFNGNPESGGVEVAGISRASLPGWTGPTDGAQSLSSTVDITVPAGSSFDHIALMDNGAGGTVRGYIAIAPSTYGEEGLYTIESGTISFPVA